MTSIMSDYRNEFKHAGNFQESMDVLAEITSTFGFTQVLYAYLPVRPRLPDGEWMPLKLNVRNFPTGWYSGWKILKKMIRIIIFALEEPCPSTGVMFKLMKI